MSKIVCDVCGTSYPETTAQCPICGYTRPVDLKSASGNTIADNRNNGTYQYVKGGRFSKANVRKRSKASKVQVRNTTANKMAKPDKGKDKTTKGLAVMAVILVLAIIAVVVYISLKFFAPSVLENPEQLLPPMNAETGETGGVLEIPATQGTQGTEPKIIACTGVMLDVSSVTLDKIGSARMVYATVEPEDTTDVIVFTSNNEEVAVVSEDGKITAMGPGEAVVRVVCGDYTAICNVSCTDIPEEETTEATTAPTEAAETFALNRSDITFSKKNESWLLYSGSIAKNQINWSSDDTSVATIEGGKVVAIGGGMTKVHGEYNGTKVSCIIRCNFADGDQGVEGNGGGVSEDGGGITEDGSGSAVSSGYQLYNPYGSAEDVSIRVGESFSLKLMDSTGQFVEPTWSVADSACCSASGNTFTGVSAGTTSITATYDGSTYTCVVRVSGDSE